MRRFFGFLLTMTLLGGGAFWLPYLQAKPVDNVYQAADLLRQDAENGGNGVAFREDNVDADEVYRALEAQYPYAFALHAVTRPNKTIELNTEVSRQARQEQAWEYARVLAAGSVSQTMTAEEKLRALHDTLIRQCEYDVDTAEEDAPDGSAPAFAADGALLDHKAVCAGYGRAYEMLCKAAGIQVIYVASEEMNHGWNAVRLGGTTYYIDCTFDDPIPDRGEYVSDQYFMLTGKNWRRRIPGMRRSTSSFWTVWNRAGNSGKIRLRNFFKIFCKKGVDIYSIMDYTKQVVSERAITTEKDMAV